jgi:hypothetical protein
MLHTASDFHEFFATTHVTGEGHEIWNLVREESIGKVHEDD